MLKLSCLLAWLSRYRAVNTLFVSAERLCCFAGIRVSVSEKDGIFSQERKSPSFSLYFKGCAQLCQSGFSGQAGETNENNEYFPARPTKIIKIMRILRYPNQKCRNTGRTITFAFDRRKEKRQSLYLDFAFENQTDKPSALYCSFGFSYFTIFVPVRPLMASSAFSSEVMIASRFSPAITKSRQASTFGSMLPLAK